jgi:hypothetical protein
MRLAVMVENLVPGTDGLLLRLELDDEGWSIARRPVDSSTVNRLQRALYPSPAAQAGLAFVTSFIRIAAANLVGSMGYNTNGWIDASPLQGLSPAELKNMHVMMQRQQRALPRPETVKDPAALAARQASSNTDGNETATAQKQTASDASSGSEDAGAVAKAGAGYPSGTAGSGPKITTEPARQAPKSILEVIKEFWGQFKHAKNLPKEERERYLQQLDRESKERKQSIRRERKERSNKEMEEYETSQERLVLQLPKLAARATYRKAHKAMRHLPPRGAVMVSGMVELEAKKGFAVIEVVAWWVPQKNKFDYRSMAIGVRRVQMRRQAPVGR